MDLTVPEVDIEFRTEVRGWLESHRPSSMPVLDTAEGFAAHREWERTMFGARLSAVSWPEQYGGRGASLWQWLIFEEEYYRAEAPVRVSQNGLFLLAPTLFDFGTPEQRERFLVRMARADDVWAQAWSEPEAGSDLASLRSTAARVDGGWRLNGQKIWSTRAPFADWCFGLFRSDPDSTRHRGLTYFLVPLTAAGVTVRPIDQLDGRPSFGEIFFDDVFVPDSDVLGEVGSGWRVAMATASSERGLSLRSPGRFLATADRLVELARQRDGALPAESRAAVAQGWMDADAYRLATAVAVSRMAEGEGLGPEMSLNKLFWSEMDVRVHATALRLLGERGELSPLAPAAPYGGRWADDWLFSLPGTIWGGANEVQRGIVAERVLGLPRGRA
ncbi:acyl-CoA dehydrogenase family protein [Pseudonocardia dioxanivorans]|jgi:alkylation response protein AidB-like acyl-CoA dehydrogenase|uniref:acyl-CoA dehydrogenase family protein n=1 Tax=Pseudonocardia dioxanivorans TaxID=240495 RepID=UPI000CD2B005|nr:acyl-CoA dehydrogenase family protein [Pseudonocardia dioxanivorans]